MIGLDKKCFWGCIGVLWKWPIPVDTGRPKLLKSTFKVEYIMFRNIDIGFPGKMIDGQEVLQTETTMGAKNDGFQITGVDDLEHKDLKMIITQDDPSKTLDVLNGLKQPDAHLVRMPIDKNRET